jgi:ATP-dependent Clp protease ATP-binding subunit ClpC
MRHAFTQTLALAIRHADDQARQLSQEFVGTEHLLLGLLATDKGQAVRALQQTADLEAIRKALLKSLPHARKSPNITGPLPLSPAAQHVVNDAMREAQSAGHSEISTKYLLWALLENPESAVHQILSDSGADLDELDRVLHDSSAATEP